MLPLSLDIIVDTEPSLLAPAQTPAGRIVTEDRQLTKESTYDSQQHSKPIRRSRVGAIVTKPRWLKDKRPHLNANSDFGQITVEALDPRGPAARGSIPWAALIAGCDRKIATQVAILGAASSFAASWATGKNATTAFFPGLPVDRPIEAPPRRQPRCADRMGGRRDQRRGGTAYHGKECVRVKRLSRRSRALLRRSEGLPNNLFHRLVVALERLARRHNVTIASRRTVIITSYFRGATSGIRCRLNLR